MREADVVRVRVGEGDTGIWGTVRLMHDLVVEQSKSPVVREGARRALEFAPAHDDLAEVQAIYQWVQERVRYTKDPDEHEYIQAPEWLVGEILEDRTPLGDCDDMTALLLSLLRSVGYPVALKITAYDAPWPMGSYSHIYGLVQVQGHWVVVDPIRPDFRVGQEGAGPLRESVIPITENVPVWLVIVGQGWEWV